MYTLKEWWMLLDGKDPINDWDGRMFCIETDAELTYRTNETQGFLVCYTFTLIKKGCLTLIYNGREIKLKQNDLYIYSPGMSVTITDVSQDYKGICLFIDEHTMFENPSVRDLVSMEHMPIVRLSEPKLSLSAEDAMLLGNRMHEIICYFYSDNIYRQQVLNMLFTIFMLDLLNFQEHSAVNRHIPPRIEEIFIGFNRLLPRHFAEHHDIGFYADKLNITPDYLSRIVKRISGRTVIDYINQMLIMEASWLLKNSDNTITQVADALHFADSASFSKFFARLKGMTPKEYRAKK